MPCSVLTGGGVGLDHSPDPSHVAERRKLCFRSASLWQVGDLVETEGALALLVITELPLAERWRLGWRQALCGERGSWAGEAGVSGGRLAGSEAQQVGLSSRRTSVAQGSVRICLSAGGPLGALSR